MVDHISALGDDNISFKAQGDLPASIIGSDFRPIGHLACGPCYIIQRTGIVALNDSMIYAPGLRLTSIDVSYGEISQFVIMKDDIIQVDAIIIGYVIGIGDDSSKDRLVSVSCFC